MAEDHYCGIGVLARERYRADGSTLGLEVVQVGSASPAEKVGLRAGDLLLKVREEGGEWRPLDLGTQRLRGPADTVIDLRIERDGKPIEIDGIARSGITQAGLSLRGSRFGCGELISNLGDLVPNLPLPSRSIRALGR